MKLSNYIINLGRAVAYYPGLRRITSSVTATILLCQLLYWTDKTKDGWIWKTSFDIEHETGLTVNEQRTARAKLEELNLVDYEYKRLDHTSRYKVNQDELNKQWEDATTEQCVTPIPTEPEKTPEPPKSPERRLSARGTVTQAEKKGDLLDGWLAAADSPGIRREREKARIQSLIEVTLHINTETKRWEPFISFAHTRVKKGEPIETFLEWAVANGFDPIYWTPEKMTTVWPQAFIQESPSTPKANFVTQLPERVEEEFVPIPKSVTRK